MAPQRYALLVDEEDFDASFSRIRERALTYWADPGQTRREEINTRDGGRGLYFEDPDGHMLEILTRTYGRGGHIRSAAGSSILRLGAAEDSQLSGRDQSM